MRIVHGDGRLAPALAGLPPVDRQGNGQRAGADAPGPARAWCPPGTGRLALPADGRPGRAVAAHHRHAL